MQVDNAKVDEYLKKIHPKTCPLCGGGQWNITTTIYQVPEYEEKGGLLSSKTTIPVVPLSCTNCGNTYFINAIVAKLVESNRKNADAPEDQKGE